MSELFTQGIGFLGLFFYVISFQMKKNRWLLTFQLAGNVLFTIQFLILDGWGGCLNSFISIIRVLMILSSNKIEKFSWKGWAYILSGLSLIVTILSWNGIVSLFPFISITVGNFIYWTRNSKTIRKGMLFGVSPSWIVYGILIRSYGGIITEAFDIVSILVSVYRYGWKALDKVD